MLDFFNNLDDINFKNLRSSDMFDKFRNERIGNIVIFFVSNTKDCGITKLNKLFYLADFHAFRQSGKSITGYYYEAWEYGPAPQPFYNDFRSINENNVPEYLNDYIDREIVQLTEEQNFNKFTPKKAFDKSYFSENELKILRSIARKYKNYKSEELVKLSHLTIPFKKVFEEGKNNRIDYFDAVENDGKIFKGESLPKEELIERQEDFYFLKQVLS